MYSINIICQNLTGFTLSIKGQIISKGLLVSSNSPKKRTNEFVFTTTTNSFVRFLGEFEDTKKTFRNYLTFSPANQKGVFLILISDRSKMDLIFSSIIYDNKRGRL